MKMATSQQYCLRWNNHRSNLLTVFDQLLQNEAFTDVTLACDGGTSVKCHKMVLAACSPYFQCLFTDLPCRHPVVVLKDVKYSDMKAILEYMYRGEVNVAHDQLAALLKVAEALRVKGLVEENGTAGKPEPDQLDSSSPPRIGTSTTPIASVPHSSVSPPHSTHGNGEVHTPPGYHKPYNMFKGQPENRNRMNLPLWAVPMSQPPPSNHPHAAATAAAMLTSCYEAASSDMSPLRRKKLQSLLMSGDTPILRTVLRQGQVDSSQPVPLLCSPHSQERVHFNGSSQENDRGMVKPEPSEDAPSPYTDISNMEDDTSPGERANKSMPTSSPSDARAVSSGIATYVPQQKPEWKRYKQYTRNDILSAIEAVRSGMSALQAARKYGVPSRTLYDKVKKLGITTSRPFKRGSNGGNAPAFPYSMSMFDCKSEPMFGCKTEPDEAQLPPHPGGQLLEPMFLQHALERGKGGGDYGEREALMALAAHAQASAGSGSTHNSSPEYKWTGSMTPSPNDEPMDDEDQVEDLSVNRKEPHQLPTGSVIVPPMSHLNAKNDDERNRIRDDDRNRIRDDDRNRIRDDDRNRIREEDRNRMMDDERSMHREDMDDETSDRSTLEVVTSPVDSNRRD